MEVPDDLRYTKEHEWVRVEDGAATVGITAFAQDELGEIVFVELPAAGAEFGQGDVLCVVESTKAASDVYVPIRGKVKDVNAALNDGPNLVNASPYDQGWMVKLEGIDQQEITCLMSADEYRAMIE